MKKRTMIDLVIIFILLGVLIFLGTRDYSKNEKEDRKRFDEEYSLVSKDNVFKYTDAEQTLKIMKENGIIFMGFSENEWSNYYAKMLNDVAKESGIDTIYYYDFSIDRKKDSVTYEKIVTFLKNYLTKDDMNKIDIYAPCLVVIQNGIVFAYDDETTFVNGSATPKTYWTEENMNVKKEQFKTIFELYLGGDTSGGTK